MYTARNYVRASSAEEAWQLNQKRANAILGGGCWMRLGKRRYDTLIDLCDLGLDRIEEHEGVISIGAMATLRQLEESPLLREAYGAYFKDCTRHIVGVQFRNCATVGGSVRARFGFSDILTALLALESSVVLHRGGEMALADYAAMGYDRDVLLEVRIRPEHINRAAYESMRNSATDIPVLTCAASKGAAFYRLAVGARPGRAVALEGTDPEELISRAAALPFGGNMRAGAAYRAHLAAVLARRALKRLEEAEA